MFKSLRSFKVLGLMLLLSGLTLAIFFQVESILAPGLASQFRWMLYRVVFFVTLPLRLLIERSTETGHEWTLPFYLLLGLALPLYYLACWWLLARVSRLLASRPASAGWAFALAAEGGNGPAPSARPLPSALAASPKPTPENPATEDPALEGGDFVMGRRPFLLSAAVGTVGLATGGLGGYASLIEPEKLLVRHYSVAIRDLPPAMQGLRVIHVSDTHFGPFVAMSYLRQSVAKINGLGGDVIVLTGDYVHRTKRSVDPGIGVLGDLRARLGSVAVLGNHDHWEGARRCRDAFGRIGLPLIDNHHLYLTPEGLSDRPQPGRSLCLAGVGDLWEDRVLLDKALGGVPEIMPRLLLAHNPDVAEMIEPGCRVDLMVCGHTHGGQVRLPLVGSPFKVCKYGEKYLGGLCQGPGGPVIVSRGIGMSGIPVRLGVPPEIGVITLLRAV